MKKKEQDSKDREAKTTVEKTACFSFFFLAAVSLFSCGTEGQGSGVSATRPLPKTEVASAGGGKSFSPNPRVEAVAKPLSPEARLEALGKEIGNGGPQAATILYAALSDSEPLVRQRAAEWLGILVREDPEIKREVEDLQEKEFNREVRQRVADLLASGQEESMENQTLPDEMPPEEAAEENR